MLFTFVILVRFLVIDVRFISIWELDLTKYTGLNKTKQIRIFLLPC